MFIMVGGIDGSGKNTLIQHWASLLARRGYKIFNIKQYWQAHQSYPALKDITKYDVFISCEPTLVGIGKIIREELIRQNVKYPSETIAQAYALDRIILYTRLIIPLLKKNKIVIQERGISSSFAYQPLQNHLLTIKKVSRLEGNALALEHRPDYLVITDIKPGEALSRLKTRAKKDNTFFEKSSFQKKLATVYQSTDYQQLFTRIGTVVKHLSTAGKIDIMKKNATILLNHILNF